MSDEVNTMKAELTGVGGVFRPPFHLSAIVDDCCGQNVILMNNRFVYLGPHDPPNVCDQANATESGIVGWWGGRSVSLIDLSQCRLHDYPAGLHYLAFNYPQDFDHPDEVSKQNIDKV